MKKGIIESLQSKPAKYRKTFALSVSTGFAGMVLIYALITMAHDVKRIADERAATPVVKESFFAQVKNMFTNSPFATTTSTSTKELIVEDPLDLDSYKVEENATTSVVTPTTTLKQGTSTVDR